MTELKFTVNAEDPEALLKLAEICKSIADTVRYGYSPTLLDTEHIGNQAPSEVLRQPGSTGTPWVPTSPEVTQVPGAPLIVPGLETQTQTPGLETQTQTPGLETQTQTPGLETQTQTPFSKLADLETLTDLKTDSTVQSGDLKTDSKGRPWDIRIHSSSKNKLKKTGEWKLKRGADPALVTQLLNAPLTQIQEPTQTQTQEPAQTAGPIQENLFTTLMTNLTKWLGEGSMNMKHVNDILARFNVPSVEYLQTCNDNNLISTVNFKLVEQWQLLNPNPA